MCDAVKAAPPKGLAALATRNADQRRRPVLRMNGGVSLRALISIIAFCAAAPILVLGAGYIVPIVAAIVAGLILGPLQGRMVARGVAGGVAASILVLSVLALLGGLTLLTAGSFASWMNDLPRIGFALRELIIDLRAIAISLKDAGEAVAEATGVDPVGNGSNLTDFFGSGFGSGLGVVAMQTPVFLGQIVVFFALLFFLLESRLRLRAGLLRLCMTPASRLRAAHIFRDAEARVSVYLLTVTAINLALGLATTIAMFLLGLPNPVLWGVLAFALNYAPYLGPSVLIILLFGAGLVSFDETGQALLPALAFFSLNALEANFLTPAIVGSQLKLEPVILIVTLVLLFGLWGIAGAVLAVPMVLIIQAILQHTVFSTRAS